MRESPFTREVLGVMQEAVTAGFRIEIQDGPMSPEDVAEFADSLHWVQVERRFIESDTAGAVANVCAMLGPIVESGASFKLGGAAVLTFTGYNDGRELCEVPEIVSFARELICSSPDILRALVDEECDAARNLFPDPSERVMIPGRHMLVALANPWVWRVEREDGRVVRVGRMQGVIQQITKEALERG